MAGFPTGVVIVGGSAAGLSTADGLREGGYTGAIIVLDENDEPGFDRPMLSKGMIAAGRDVTPHPLRTPERLAANDITVMSGHAAVGLDIDRRHVVTTYGEAIPFEHVVIATGVDAKRLRTTSGTVLPALRTLADLDRAREMVTEHGQLTIIGGGFIGLEVAAALAEAGVAVTVLHSSPEPLARGLGRGASAWLCEQHRAHGVRLITGAAVDTIDEVAGGYRITMSDGTTHDAPAILAGVGVAPQTDWLVGSGVELNGGVLVDEAGRTNVPGVWAAGDVAVTVDTEGNQRCYQHWTRAIEQGRTVGLNIACADAAAHDGLPYLWTEQFGHTVHVFGLRDPEDAEHVVLGDLASGEFVIVHGRGEEFRAVTISGFPTAIRTYKKLLKQGASLPQALDAARA